MAWQSRQWRNIIVTVIMRLSVDHAHTHSKWLVFFPGWSMAPGFIYLLFCWVESRRFVATQGRRLCRNDSTCCPTETVSFRSCGAREVGGEWDLQKYISVTVLMLFCLFSFDDVEGGWQRRRRWRRRSAAERTGTRRGSSGRRCCFCWFIFIGRYWNRRRRGRHEPAASAQGRTHSKAFGSRAAQTAAQG